MKRWSAVKLLITSAIVLGIICFFSVPYFLSGSYGEALLEKRLHTKIGGKWEAKGLKVTWFGPQKLSSLKGAKEDFAFSGESLTLFTHLFNVQESFEWPFPNHLTMKKGTVSFQDELLLENIEVENSSNRTVTMAANARNGNVFFKAVTEPQLSYRLTLDNIPSVLLDLFKKKVPLSAIVGPSFSLEIRGKGEGQTGSFKSSSLLFSYEGTYKDGLVTLTAPMTGRFALSPELSDKLFAHTSIQPRSTSAITWSFDSGSTLPMIPFNASKIQIPSGIVNLGKMQFLNMRTVSDVLSILKSNVRPNSNIPIWFQGMRIDAQDGICNVKQSAMLVDNTYELITWGKVNLPETTMEMFIALTKQALETAFNFRSVPRDYLIPMRLDGPWNNLHLHKSRALRLIAKLIIMQQSPILISDMYPDTGAKLDSDRPAVPWRKHG